MIPALADNGTEQPFVIGDWPRHERPPFDLWCDGIRWAESARAEHCGSVIGPASDVCDPFVHEADNAE